MKRAETFKQMKHAAYMCAYFACGVFCASALDGTLGVLFILVLVLSLVSLIRLISGTKAYAF